LPGVSLKELAGQLNKSAPAVGYYGERAGVLARENGCLLIA